MPITLTIRHHGQKNGQMQFVVTPFNHAKTTAPVSLNAPNNVTLPNHSNSHLANDLRWYLERFLDDPFEPNTSLAEEIQDALMQWGKETYGKLVQGNIYDWLQETIKLHPRQLIIRITSNDARILAWPWEVLQDSEGLILSHTCRIERQLNVPHNPRPLIEKLPTDCVNVLLVIANPYENQNVRYHALARPLVELCQRQSVPMRVDILRPPTFDQLRKVLQEKPGFYHVVHFEGYGGYGTGSNDINIYSDNPKQPWDRLCFETQEGEIDTIEAAQLAQLINETNIPIAILNICPSTGTDDRANEPCATIAATFLKTGIHSVIAMSYSLHVRAAQLFVSAFYRSLFQLGSVPEALHAGRRAMLVQPQRFCARGEYPLQDWLVPVLYQQQEHHLEFNTISPSQQATKTVPLPPAAAEYSDYGFIGRNRTIHKLERLLQQHAQAGLLIHGKAGIGKTSLVQGFVQWLQHTGGLGEGVFWFRFDNIRSVEDIISQMTAGLFGTSVPIASTEQKIDNLCAVFKQHRFIMVWDNFESASGIEGTEVTGLMPDNDRKLLKNFLHRLQHGKTKIIITSRSPETWLSATDCFRLALHGLQGEECWQYCDAVMHGLDLTIDRSDRSYSNLIKKMDGHPLAIRAISLKLAQTAAANLLDTLEQNLNDAEQNEINDAADTVLGLLESCFPPEYTATLQFIGLHQRYVQFDTLIDMMKNSAFSTSQITINACFTVLERAGLVHPLKKNIYTIHAMLQGYLRRQHPAETTVQSAFVDLMGHFAEHLTSKEFRIQRAPFFIHGANFHFALSLAKTLKMTDHAVALSQFLATFAQNNRDFQVAGSLDVLADEKNKT